VSSTQNVSVKTFGLNSGSGTTSQKVGVQFSTTIGTHGSTSSGPFPVTCGGLGGIGGSISSGLGGSRGK
ncbi:hypothetical protein KI387_032726, partial [Taxus chinensis]